MPLNTRSNPRSERSSDVSSTSPKYQMSEDRLGNGSPVNNSGLNTDNVPSTFTSSVDLAITPGLPEND